MKSRRSVPLINSSELVDDNVFLTEVVVADQSSRKSYITGGDVTVVIM